MTIGLLGVALSLVFGILIGGISGLFGGVVDNLIQRMIEFIQSVPAIPLWIGLAAAIPPSAPPLQVYFLIAIILSVLGWTSLARVVRGRFLAMRNEDFVKAARLDGCGPVRIIFRHMLPSFLSHVIATVSLAIPGVNLAETALSYLGIELRTPIVSWGCCCRRRKTCAPLPRFPGCCCRVPPWCWPCWPSTSLATGCATPSTPARTSNDGQQKPG